MGFLFRRKRKPKPKVVILGLDGVPYTLLKDLEMKGYTPGMTRIRDNGNFGKMSVCVPEISSVSWTSFMTGAQSGEHGIFGFTDLIPGTHKMFFPNFSNLKRRTIFDDLGTLGKKSVVVNLPSTYPAREISGVLISGFVAIDLKKAVYPMALYPKLQKMGYVIDVDANRGRNDHSFLLHELDVTLNSRKRLGEMLWDKEDWDLFMLVVTGTDRINHFMWDAWSDTNHERHADFIQYYQKVDKLVEMFYEKFMDLPGSNDGMNHFMMLSDHGFTGIRSEIYLNCWLKENGFLFFDKHPPGSLEDIKPQSKAFALDPSRIYINTKKRYANGSVAEEDVERIKGEIRSGLEELTYEDGAPVLRKIMDRDELYQGPRAHLGPDLALLSHHGFDLKGKIKNKSVFGLSALKGMHTQDDAFFFSTAAHEIKNIFEVKQHVIKTYG